MLLWISSGLAAAAPAQTLWDTRAGKTLTDRTFLDRLAQADVVFVGEQHDDAATHVLERQILEGLRRRAGARLTLAMEMFERDVQPALDQYLSGRSDEAAFRRAARPWPNYGTDYRPLMEYARAEHVPVIASNAPQAVVSRVGREGLAALKDTPAGQVAALIQAPHDAYWERFRRVMADMGGAHGGATMDDATVAHFYEAQVVRDETMAESVVRVLDNRPDALVLHVNGQFHSDFGGGIPQRVFWRRPLARVLIVSVVPVRALPSVLPAADRTRGDFVVYVRVQ
ncbi:MAG: ChaN family lipoprotein [Armatimonadetes bacterium]|nr:ChaN family lipoprotein [Armatimonadota bacterium]